MIYFCFLALRSRPMVDWSLGHDLLAIYTERNDNSYEHIVITNIALGNILLFGVIFLM